MASNVSIKKAALITAGSKYINIFLGIAFSAVLSRILSPNDYGVVAIVSVFTTFFIVLSNCGLGIVIIQNKDFNQKDIDSLFSFSVLLGVGLSIVFCLVSYPISRFYNDSVYIPICLILSISIFFNTINAVPDGLLRKEKKFLLIGIRLIVVSVLTYGLTIFFALAKFKYYALVLQSVISSLLIFFWNLKNVKVHFTFKIDWSVLKKIAGYSGYNFLFNFVNYFSRNLDKLMIGKVLGNEELAQYNKAYHFMLYPVQNLTNIITPVLHPILSDYQNDKKYIYEQYIKVVKILSLLGVFVTAVCFCCCKEIILILYGNQWSSAVFCFKYLSLAIWTQMIGGTAGSLFNTLGDTKKLFYSNMLNTLLIVSTLVIGLLFKDIKMVSVYLMIALNIQFFVIFFTLIKLTMKFSFLLFLKNLIFDLLIAVILFAISVSINIFLGNRIQNLFISLCTKGFIVSFVYFVLMLVFRQFKYLLPILPEKIKKKFI